MKKNYQSPSLTIMKPNLNSIFSIFNRILGLILFLMILIYVFVYFYLYVSEINNENWIYSNLSFSYIDYSNFVFFIISLGSYVFNIEICKLIFYITFIIFVSYHVIYSSFKIFTKSEKIYQIISSNINIINKLYLYLLKIISILILFIIMYLSLNYINAYTYDILMNIYFISIILIKIVIILILNKVIK